MRLASERGDPGLTADRRLGHEAVDPQFANIDIVIGQQRSVRRGRLGEFRQALQGNQSRCERADVDMAADEGEWAPIHS